MHQTESWNDRMLPFVAVGRVKDGVTLAYYVGEGTPERREQMKDIFGKLLGAAAQKLQAGQRTRLAWNDGSVCCLMDQQGVLLYCVVTAALTYPERLAYQLLHDLVVATQALPGLETEGEHAFNGQLQPKMRDLTRQYEDPQVFPQVNVAAFAINPNCVSVGNDELQNRKSVRRKLMMAAAVVLCLLVIVILILLFSGHLSSGKAALQPAAAQAAFVGAVRHSDPLAASREILM